jgi:hypothetical protein
MANQHPAYTSPEEEEYLPFPYENINMSYPFGMENLDLYYPVSHSECSYMFPAMCEADHGSRQPSSGADNASRSLEYETW